MLRNYVTKVVDIHIVIHCNRDGIKQFYVVRERIVFSILQEYQTQIRDNKNNFFERLPHSVIKTNRNRKNTVAIKQCRQPK